MNPLGLEVFQRDSDHFGEVWGRRVLVYWPHGFWDFVFLGTILSLLVCNGAVFESCLCAN